MENSNDLRKQVHLEQLNQGLQKLQQELVDLDNQKQLVYKKIDVVKSLIKDVENQESKDNIVKRQSLLRGQDFTWKTMSLEILKDKRRLLTTDEIYSEFVSLKPEFSGLDKKRNIQASFSSALAQLSDSNEVVKIDRKYGKGNYWSLPDWFGNNGSALPEFTEQFERHQLSDFKYKNPKEFLGENFLELRQ
jgi:hypothetical protein